MSGALLSEVTHERCLFVSHQDAVPFKAEQNYRSSEPEPVYSTEAAGGPEASSQQGLAYTSEPVYETTEAPGHYQAGTGPHSSHAQGRKGSQGVLLSIVLLREGCLAV